jgi:kynurenine formamidase
MNDEAVATGADVPRVNRLDADSILRALGLAREGRVFDLDSTRWHHMPVADGHPPFQVLTYRSATGIRNQGDLAWLDAGNDAQVSVVSDFVMGTVHTGTHIDGLCHVCCGPDATWFGGGSAYTDLGDFGAIGNGAETIPPIIARGVMVDVAAHLGVDALSRSYPIGLELFLEAAEGQQTEIRPGDVVLVRTGYMSVWGDPERAKEFWGAGITHPVAVHLAEQGAVAVVGDTEGLEVHPSIDPTSPLPVHVELLVKNGIHIIELVAMEELSAAKAYEFCFVALPLRIRGATGSMLRPVAIV